MYSALRTNETRVVVLYPGEPGTPLRARLEVVNIADARQVQADYTNRTPEVLGISSSQPSLYSFANTLDHYQRTYGAISSKIQDLRLLSSKLDTLIEEYEILTQKSRHSDGSRDGQFATKASPALRRLSSGELLGDKIRHQNLIEERNSLIETKDWGSMASVDDNVNVELLRLSYLLTVSRYWTRDLLTWEAFSNGAFEALSYVWGDDYHAEEISIEGTSLIITSSLFQAFQQLRLGDGTRRIWVDALCINQSDVAERTQQLAMMSQIYRAASRVIVWLGRSNETTCLGIAALNMNLARDDYSLYGSNHDLNESRSRVFAADRPLGRCLFCSSTLDGTVRPLPSYQEAVDDLVSRPWFTRMWVVQEVASATSTVEIHCGSHRTHWRAWRWHTAQYKLEKPFSGMSVISAAADYVAADFVDQPCWPSFLIWLVVQTADKKCQLPCDRFFAIQSILRIDVGQMQGIDADATPRELFTWLTGRCLTTKCASVTRISSRAHDMINVPHVSILLALAPLTPSAGDWPSWAPDFNRLPATAVHLLHEYHSDIDDVWLFGEKSGAHTSTAPSRDYCAVSCLNKMQCRMSECRRYLWIRGRYLGTVCDVQPNSIHPVYQRGRQGAACDHESADLQKEMKDWVDRCKNFVDTHLYDENQCVTLKEIIQQITPTGDAREYCIRMLGSEKHSAYLEGDVRIKNGRPTRDREAVLTMPATSREIFESCKEDLQDEGGAMCAAKVSDWVVRDLTPGEGSSQTSAHTIRERKLGALTSRGGFLVGWISPSAEPGDEVYVFQGAPRPFLIRKRKEDDSYTLLGDCWMHGMCENEIKDFCREDEDSLVDIKLR